MYFILTTVFETRPFPIRNIWRFPLSNSISSTRRRLVMSNSLSSTRRRFPLANWQYYTSVSVTVKFHHYLTPAILLVEFYINKRQGKINFKISQWRVTESNSVSNTGRRLVMIAVCTKLWWRLVL